MDRFDDVLQKFNKTYGLCDGPQTRSFSTSVLVSESSGIDDAQLKELGFAPDGDRELVESILNFSRLLLEKCGNRTLYNSTERLNELLNTTSLPLLDKTLRLTSVLAQKFAERIPQPQGQTQFYHFELDKIQKLASPITKTPPRRSPHSPVKTSKSKDKSSQPKLRRAPTTADPNDFRALGRISASAALPGDSATTDNVQELDWLPLAYVKVVWSNQVSQPISHTTTSQTITVDIPSSPSPLRQQQAATGVEPDLAQGTVGEQPGVQSVEFSASDLQATTAEEILQKVPTSMPLAARYELLHKIRVAYGLLTSAESRNLLLQIRLTALCVVGQVYREDELVTKYFSGDTNSSVRQQLVQQLVNLIREPKRNQRSVSLFIQSLALENLTVLTRHRQMATDIVIALAPNSSHGLLISLVQRGLADIAQDGDVTDNEIGDEWRDKIFNSWAIFISPSGPHPSRSSDQYVHKNLVSAYTAGLQIITNKSLRVHIPILNFLKTFIHQFRDGIQVLNANGAFGTACDATENLSKQALELVDAGQGMPEQYKNRVNDYKIPYMHQQVIRQLVDVPLTICSHQGGHADRALRSLVDSSTLLSAFRRILSHMDAFGAHTWSEVVKAICGFLNNEPTSFTVISEAGIITTLLNTVQPAPVAQGDTSERQPRTISAVPSKVPVKLPAIGHAITNLAQSFSAICLTEAGHNQFVSSNVLEKFFELFESPTHIQVIKDSHTLVNLGGTFDELIRHHPGLKNTVLSSIITMIARVRHICRSTMRRTGAGPKIWVTEPSSSAAVVAGGTQALMSEDIPTSTSSLDFSPISLPNKDTLESGPLLENIDVSVARTASDEDSHGLTTIDYARPVIGFLAAFLDSHFMCKELMNAGATDLILDFVTLPTLPVTEDTFTDGLLMQDLTSVVRAMAGEKPHLVLPFLLDRAKYVCVEGLQAFMEYHPKQIQCYFGGYLDTSQESASMDVDKSEDVTTNINGTRTVKGLMNIYSITRVLADVFTVPTYPPRATNTNILSQVNVADILSELITLLGKLSAACCREEISLLSLMPQSWLAETRPGNYSTGDSDVDAILNVSSEHSSSDDTIPSAPKPKEANVERTDSVDTAKDTPAFRNLKVLRYLLTETPASISTLFSRVGCSFLGRKRPDTIVKQRVYLISDALANALALQLNPPFMSQAFLHEDENRSRDWRFKYFTVVLSRLRDSLWEDSSSMPSSSIRQSFIVDRFRRANGIKILTAIGTEFFDELKSCQVAQPVFAANAGLKICLELLDDFSHNDIVSSMQATYMKNLDNGRPFFFNPNQLLLELRMESLPLTRTIWDSEYAEQASSDVVRRLVAVLKHTLNGQNEDGVARTPDDMPEGRVHDKRKFQIDKARVNSLKEKGFDEDVVEEALFRCNVIQGNQLLHAEEYCRALHENPARRRLAVPKDDIDYKGVNTSGSSQLASPPTGLDASNGPTATIFEDSSLDEDVEEGFDAAGNIATTESRVQMPHTTDGAAPGQSTASSAMNISSILNTPQPETQPAPSVPCYTLQTIEAERESIREDLADRCNNILSNHPNLTFDLNDLLCAAAAKLSDDAARSWWERATDLLVMSLLSQGIDSEMTESQGKKIAATAHLLGLLCSNDAFKPNMLKVLQNSLDAILGFLQVPKQKPASEEASYPWIAPILLIVEKMLALDAEPDSVTWHVPNDLETFSEPRLSHEVVVEPDSKKLLFNQLMDILPKVGKDRAMALSIVRVLVILTRDRSLALLQGERRNLQKLFLMVKQLVGGVTGRFESAFMSVLRHVIEDEETIKQVMGTEITAYFQGRSSGRQPDLTNYLRDLSHLALRSPSLFVDVSNEKIKLASWSSGQASASSVLTLRDTESQSSSISDVEALAKPSSTADKPAESIEEPSSADPGTVPATEVKVPVVEHPDGIIHFLLSELLSYKDVDDKESTPSPDRRPQVDPAGQTETSQVVDNGDGPRGIAEKAERPRYKTEEHPIFMYRCFLMHCLTELLYSYNQTKIEFISFSRKADPMAATPSKWRSGVLNYLLNGLVSSGYVDKDETITCRKRMATSEWAMKVIVALCTKTGEKDLGASMSQRYSPHQQVDDNDTEPELTYVRRFVLDHAIKAFKETYTSSETTQARYGRLLCLADLFNKLLSKPSGPEGSAGSHNNSYKMLARMMFEKNLIAVLTSAISDIDLSFPEAKKVVKFILRPLQELTTLSVNSPESLPPISDAPPADSISSASSEVSELDDDREETPDLYRNSALGILDPARQDESDTSEEDEEDEEMYDDGYDDEMDYDDGMAAPVDDGEVVSDDELEDVIEGTGPIEGLPGDVPMDIEFVVDHHHHHDGDDDESESSSDDDEDDDTEDDDEDDGEDIEIEMEDDGDIENGTSHGGSNDDGDDGWEDEDEASDDEEVVEQVDFDEAELPIHADDGHTVHLNNLLRVLGEPDVDSADIVRDPGIVMPVNDPDDHGDEDGQDDGEDADENDEMEYDEGFDMMLDGQEDYDDPEEFGFEEQPPPVFRRPRHSRAMPGFFTRRILNEHDMHHHILGPRHHRHAPSGRPTAEDGTNPLLQRPDAMSPDSMQDGTYTNNRPLGFALPSGSSMATGPIVFPGGPGGPNIAIPMDTGLGGHGAILDAIMGAIQRGDQDFLQNGRISFNVTGPNIDDIRDILRQPPMPSQYMARQPREDPTRSAQFVPMLTASRWQEEARLLFGKNLVTKTQPIQTLLMARLVPLAQKEERIRREKLEEQRKAEAEREAQRKIEEERQKKEEEERLAKEKAEAEEKARAEAAAREAAAAEASAAATENQEVAGDAMEGVESIGEGANQASEAHSAQSTRTYTTIRGRQLDITGLDIDAEYLEALPEDLREEVITAQYQARREQAQEEGNDASGIDPEFLDALPEDIREEIRTQEAAAQRRRERERVRREAHRTGSLPQAADPDPDDFLAMLDPALRRTILAEQPAEILNALDPRHAAEGRAHARSMLFHHRLPMQRELDNARSRRDQAQRDARRQVMQLIDKAGVATLLRLMFLQQHGSLKSNLLQILSNVCGNRQTRFEVVSLLLVILKEGSVDVTAVERSLASLSLRAKASSVPKTPQPLKRTLSMQPYAGVSEDVTPMLVVQQCLNTLSHICRQNGHVKGLFLREVDVTSGNKAKGKMKGKMKETKTTTHPVNDLISLLDRRLIMDNAGCLQSLASLLATVTSPLALLMRQEKERQKAEAAKAEKEANEEKVKTSSEAADEGKADVAMVDPPVTQAQPESSNQQTQVVDTDVQNKDSAEAIQPIEQEKRKSFEPPTVTDHNLKLITSIFVAPECGNDTFRFTLETLQSLSHIAETSSIFGKELIRHVQSLSQTICADLEELLPAIQDAQSSTDVQGVAAARFSASSSDQVKLLRVLQALDYLSVPKKDDDDSSEPDSKPKSILTMSYDSLSLGSLWSKLGACLAAVEEKGDTISFANILLPLIESLMVVCKHTTLKDTPIAQSVKEQAVASPTAAEPDNLEDLFYKFTSDHRKILNDIVRQSPKLMQGHFSILVKNSKVLDFDNKRNYFNKQIHSRHHAQRHPQPPLQLNVRRDQVFIDSYKALYFKSADEMKYGKLNIRFNGEEGVDAGGVTREWFQVLARGMFDPNYALFQPVASDRTTFHPSPLSRVNDEHLLYFKFIGRIIGKALHEGRVLDCHFSRAVYKRILGKSPNLKDLESNDVDYYKSLVWILENDITDILTEEFCVIEDEFGVEKVIDLIPGGRDIAVTEENKKEYVQKLVEYRLTESVKEQLDSFLGGFHDIIPAELVAIFNEQELELLISGLPEIDVDDWKANTEYHNYNPSSQQVVWFWRIVKAMSNEERAKLLQFITGTSKVPLNGFKELEGVSGLTKCNIHKDPSTNRLPTSHTCFNQLDLPAYESFEVMKQNITTAISLGADYFGFA